MAASRTTATTLKVTGLPADLERAFAVSLHSYEVPAHGSITSYSFHAPLNHATIPDEISASVTAVVGLDSRPNFRPRGADQAVNDRVIEFDGQSAWIFDRRRFC